jgi:hypothetical protein
MRTTTLVIFLMIVWATATAQVKQDPKRDLAISYSNANLGFRYAPPSGMRNETERFRSQIQAEAKASGATDAHAALLEMSSGEDGADPNWRLLTIETYPRSAVSDSNDANAEAKISAWLAHSEDANASSNKSVVISGQTFSISLFGLQDGPVKKGATVWTTIRKGKFLSFFFAANSPEQLDRLTESMKSLQFF